MNYVPLGIKTDYSLLTSLIKIDDLIDYALKNNIQSLGIIDNNLFSSGEFYFNCIKNNLKPIIGLEIEYEEQFIYLYAINYQGYQNLIKIDELKQTKLLTKIDLELYSSNLLLVIPYAGINYYNELKLLFEEVYISYQNEVEKKNIAIITNNYVFIYKVKCLSKEDEYLLKFLSMIKNEKTINEFKKSILGDSFLLPPNQVSIEDTKTTIKFGNLFNLIIPKPTIKIPKYSEKIANSNEFLKKLSIKGLKKRFNNNLEDKYKVRLTNELKVIMEMGFVDYFLIVYDYVLYAKKNNIYVGPGRGSAAGSLVAYSLGIIDIDPLKYNLLFERFLNKERKTMPDIDIDFEDTKRDLIKEYLITKYGKDYVSSIITFSTLGTKQVIRDVLKVLNLTEPKLLSEIKANLSLEENYERNNNLKEILKTNTKLKEAYKIAIKLQGIKKQISTHASGLVMANEKLNNIIPMYHSNNNSLTGITMDYLEKFGLLKMDLLALNNLTTMHNCLDLIKNLNIKEISLDDEKTFKLFQEGNTDAIFQFETNGMKQFLRKLKPVAFSDLYAAVALFRPGPMENIDLFIERKNNKQKIQYLHPDLEDILKETYGIIIYQEQIIEILAKMAGYTYSESDIVRRSITKKDYQLLNQEKEKFINRAIKNNYSQDNAFEVFNLILKFASYGFNKSHSVAYALISYQLAYLKANYPLEFLITLLNQVIGSVNKTKEYIILANSLNIKIMPCHLLLSGNIYSIENDMIRSPLTIIKGINENIYLKLKRISEKNITDFFDFIRECFKENIEKSIIVSLIETGCLDYLNYSRLTLLNNLDNALNYAELVIDDDNLKLINKPLMEDSKEMSSGEIISKEINHCGFYLSNHPANQYYQKNMIKVNEIAKYFDHNINVVVLVEKIKKIKTKKNDDMAFITGSDETGVTEFLLFSNNYEIINNIIENQVINILGKVTKKNDKYSIIINKIKNV